MAWDSAVITNAGAELLKRFYAGEKLLLDYATGGTGTVAAEALLAQTALKDQRQQFSIVQVTEVTGGQKLNISVENQSLTTGYTMQQLGIWAHAGDGAPVLLGLLQDATGIQIPSNTEIVNFTLNFYAVLAISGDAEIEITMDPTALVSENRLAEALRLKPDIYIGDVEPTYGPVLWFDTGAVAGTSLKLSEDSSKSVVITEVDGTTFGVENAGVNETPTTERYSFDII